MSTDINRFIKEFSKELAENNAAIFAGAGLSVDSGHVNWQGLLEDFADELGLDVNRETDLIAVAQYYLNKNHNNRHALSQKIANEFHVGKLPNDNHKILARLPIFTYWTTNYDRLIEKALENSGKKVDVKYTIPHLALTIHGRDAIVYKMHGDVENSDKAIISKDDYEAYYMSHGAYINTLSGDLISKTFLFIGFSFTDPNLDYILSRIRVNFQNNTRKHYCFFKELDQLKDEAVENFQYRKTKQALIIQDLARFNIHVILVKKYSDITSILKKLEDVYKRKTVYISGSAHEYGTWHPDMAESFITKLSEALINDNYKIVSGFGLGVGSFVINGVLQEVYIKRKEFLKGQLLLRPFPQGEEGKKCWEEYRKDMISYSGVSIFIFGNKINSDNNLVLADGLDREFDISVAQKSLIIPIGATGYKAKELWEKVNADYRSYYGSNDHKDLFDKLGDETIDYKDLIKYIIEFMSKFLK